MPFSLSVVWLCLVIKSCSLRLRRVGGLGVGVACVSTHHTMLRRFALLPELFGSSAERFFMRISNLTTLRVKHHFMFMVDEQILHIPTTTAQ